MQGSHRGERGNFQVVQAQNVGFFTEKFHEDSLQSVRVVCSEVVIPLLCLDYRGLMYMLRILAFSRAATYCSDGLVHRDSGLDTKMESRSLDSVEGSKQVEPRGLLVQRHRSILGVLLLVVRWKWSWWEPSVLLLPSSACLMFSRAAQAGRRLATARPHVAPTALHLPLFFFCLMYSITELVSARARRTPRTTPKMMKRVSLKGCLKKQMMYVHC